MKKFFTFLLALALGVGMMNAKVTWNSSNISDLNVYATYESYSKEGVTLRGNADQIRAEWYGYGDESMDGISFNADETGGFTFSNTLGKNFTKIEMFPNSPGSWDMANLGSGWSFSWDFMNDKPVTITWTGNASTVDLLKDESNFHGGGPVKSIVFYFEGDSEEPDPTYTVALQDGTVNADKVTLSATSAVEGATVTVTPDEEYEITAFKATYNTTEELSTSFNAETGAYSFTMPAYDVTIEATIALKPVPEGDIFAGFTATAGSGGFGGEGHANLVDNKYISSDWTKWCANNDHKSVPTVESESCWWIDFEASAALNPTGYILTTGNDTGSEHGRNPKNWVLKAKLNADDAWTTIATVTDDVTMKNQSFKDYKFFVDQSGSYKYFRFEVFANQGANVMQLCELRLIGTEPLADCGLSWKDVPEGGVVGIIGHEDEIVLPQVNASQDFILAYKAGTVSLRLGSTDESVLKVFGFNNFQVVSTGECDVYVVHDEDAVFAYDSAAFHVTINPEPTPAGNVVIWNMSMDAVNGIVEQNETKEVFGGITLTVGAWRTFMMNGNVNALLFAFNSKAEEGFTFANTLGVNFKKIVLSGAANTFDGKESTGWVINEDKSTITWEGDAASVSIWETLNFIGPVIVNEVEFTLEGGEPEPGPTPTVWTALKVGDVIKVGDKIEVPAEGDGSWGINGNVLRNTWGPYELIRADIYQASDFDDPEVTETEDGAFYVFKAENSDFYPLSYLGKSGGLVVTATSDGLVVTAAENKEFTVAVHDKGDTPTGVENAQTNQVQGTKILRDGMLLIIRDGKTYNVVGTVVR